MERLRFLGVYAQALATLLCFGGTTLAGWLSFAYILVWLADFLNAPSAAGGATAALHAAASSSWRRCCLVFGRLSGRRAHGRVPTATVLLPFTILLLRALCVVSLQIFLSERRWLRLQLRLRGCIAAVLVQSLPLAAWTVTATVGQDWSPWLSFACSVQPSHARYFCPIAAYETALRASAITKYDQGLASTTCRFLLSLHPRMLNNFLSL